jgi:hypothetical protein
MERAKTVALIVTLAQTVDHELHSGHSRTMSIDMLIAAAVA